MTCDETRCLFIRTHNELGTALNPRVMGEDDEDGVVLKRKVVDGSAAKRTRGATDAFVDPTHLRAGTHVVFVLLLVRMHNGLARFLE